MIAADQNEISNDKPRSRVITIRSWFSATGPGFESPYRYHRSKRSSVSDALLEVAMRGSDDPRVHTNRSGAPETFDLSLLEHAKQLDLDVAGEIPDLVEEDGRSMSQLEPAELPLAGAGVGAFLSAEQLAFQQRGRKSGAVDSHHRLRAPCAEPVHFRCKQFLAAASFAEQEHGRIGRRHLPNLFQDAADGVTLTDDSLRRPTATGIAPQDQVLRTVKTRRCRGAVGRVRGGPNELQTHGSCLSDQPGSAHWPTGAPGRREQREQR